MRHPPIALTLTLASLLVAAGCRSHQPSTEQNIADAARAKADAAITMDSPPPQVAQWLPDPNLDRLAAFMIGSFSSEEQAKADPENFRPIVLHMARIWRDRPEGTWLYVEQAVATAQDRPYRQRIYHLTVQSPGVIRSDVYTLPGEARSFTGAWRDESKLWGVTPDRLTLRDGCSITLTLQPDGTFQGATSGTGCGSELAGARYATSEAHIFPDRMVTWDRGFNDKGEQVWGAEKGGYIFVKAPPTVW